MGKPGGRERCNRVVDIGAEIDRLQGTLAKVKQKRERARIQLLIDELFDRLVCAVDEPSKASQSRAALRSNSSNAVAVDEPNQLTTGQHGTTRDVAQVAATVAATAKVAPREHTPLWLNPIVSSSEGGSEGHTAETHRFCGFAANITLAEARQVVSECSDLFESKRMEGQGIAIFSYHSGRRSTFPDPAAAVDPAVRRARMIRRECRGLCFDLVCFKFDSCCCVEWGGRRIVAALCSVVIRSCGYWQAC
jgi:hypothetical protein